MTLLYYDPIFLQHNTGNHPENSARLDPTIRHINSLAMASMYHRPSWPPASLEQVQLVHTHAYFDDLKSFANAGGGNLEQDTVVSQESFDVALMAAGAVCDAVERVVRGESKTAFCLVRPPGHHALPNQAMGFCLFNNVAIGARVAIRELGIERVMIVDWDVHHGNGTQAMFWEDPLVAYFSIHRSPFYPYTGEANETGAGPGAGMTCNVPIEFGTPRQKQLDSFEQKLTSFADEFAPQLILISAGFDSHKDDPIGSLGLETNDFRSMTAIVKTLAEKHCNGRIISVLEGGYNPIALAECVTCHLEELQETP
ncbi:MAG: acetoin utilization deacetylase AcuC-like enzyme [Mariniblastus sp.]|jgi:acetoin utilization deacetylase AcuC-like enzyme